MKPVEINVNFLYHFETPENHRFFMFLGGRKREYCPEMGQTTTIFARAAQFDVVGLKR